MTARNLHLLVAASLLFGLAPRALAFCAEITGGVTQDLSTNTMTARAAGDAQCRGFLFEIDYTTWLAGELKLHQGLPPADYVSPINSQGTYIGSVQAPASYSVCYWSAISVSGGGSSFNPPPTNNECMPEPPPPPPPPNDQCDPATNTCSPIIFNLANGGYQLTGAIDPVLFDISASGTPRSIGWTATGADEPFLWLDRNHNGIVDDGSELFGNATPLRNGQRAGNGFIALAEFDSNGDGVIDAGDAIWNSLQLWYDRNHDGVTQSEEVESIAASSVTEIGLAYQWTGRRDQFGNTFRYEGLLREGNRSRPFYDIFFATVP